ncbi:MAG: hypothetical protein PHS62_04520 [Patescibacteria group bacterium]|nr:hypothetical protein [Patescibacteria group bacterium]
MPNPADNLSELVVFTSTQYGDDEVSRVRSRLCLNMLKNARDIGVAVAVKDGGSNQEFINEAEKLDNIILARPPAGERKSMGADRRDALALAVELAKNKKMQTPCFLWVEPEKDNLISRENLENMLAEIKRGSNIVVPSRKEKAWETLPRNQRWFEQRANKRSLELINKFTDGRHRELLDLWFGPKMFDEKGAEFFQKYNKDNDKLDMWDAHIVATVEAIKAGKKVTSVPVDYEYSRDQRLSETEELKKLFDLKRLEQYAQILKEMGDPKWRDFFGEAKEALVEIKKLKKENPSPEASEALRERKKSVLKTFFRMR